jgi:hypothetical protein
MSAGLIDKLLDVVVANGVAGIETAVDQTIGQ